MILHIIVYDFRVCHDLDPRSQPNFIHRPNHFASKMDLDDNCWPFLITLHKKALVGVGSCQDKDTQEILLKASFVILLELDVIR